MEETFNTINNNIVYQSAIAVQSRQSRIRDEKGDLNSKPFCAVKGTLWTNGILLLSSYIIYETLALYISALVLKIHM